MSGEAGPVAAGDVQVAADGIAPARVRAILAERARAAGGGAAATARPTIAALAWSLGGERFALPLADLAEVAPACPPTPLPGAAPGLLGLIVHRGRLHTLLDPSAALGVARGDGPGHVLLLRVPPPRLALRVDAALGLVAVEAAADDGLTRVAIADDEAGAGRIALVSLPRLRAALGVGAPPPAREG